MKEKYNFNWMFPPARSLAQTQQITEAKQTPSSLFLLYKGSDGDLDILK